MFYAFLKCLLLLQYSVAFDVEVLTSYIKIQDLEHSGVPSIQSRASIANKNNKSLLDKNNSKLLHEKTKADATTEAKYDCSIRENKRYRRNNNYTNGIQEIPMKFDWRSKKVIQPARNKGDCNAAWAFAIVGAIESHLIIYKNDRRLLSEQFLIDCIPKSTGCNPDSLLKTICYMVTVLGGVLPLDDYPYTENRKTCEWNPPSPVPITVSGFQRVKPDESAMMEALVRHGPLVAAIHRYPIDAYRGNYLIVEPPPDACSQDPSKMNYAVIIVGYSVYTDKKKSGLQTPYWIIQNSNGPEWGDKGYLFLIRGQNACGIANDVLFPYVN